jgi:hypothetical protein
MKTGDGVSDFTKIRALIESDAWLEIAALFEQAKWGPGRRRHFEPHVLALYFLLTMYVWQSARHTAAEVADATTWSVIRKLVEVRHQDRPEVWLPERAPRRHHYLYFRRNHLDERTDELIAILERTAVRAARELQLCDPDGRGSFNHPDATQTLVADGKVITPLFKSMKATKLDKATGELRPVRHDADARVHVTGDKRRVFGNKFSHVAVRGKNVYERIILSVAHVGKGSEGPALQAMLDAIIPRLPGAQAIAYDGGIRGKDRNRIITNHGLDPVVPPHGSKQDPDNIPGPRLLEARDGLQLYTYLGGLGICDLDEGGNLVFRRMRRKKKLRRRNKDGTYRCYGEYEHPLDHGRVVRVPLYQTADDDRRGINRAENLRVTAPGDDDYDLTMALRSESERINRALEDTLYIKRAHSVGKIRQLADLVGFAIGVNALALYAWRHRTPPS